MSNDEFKTIIEDFRHYLKPELFGVLIENADIFSNKTKSEIIVKLQEADHEMQELYDYQEKRNGMLQIFIGKIEALYNKLKSQFETAVQNERSAEVQEADKLITNI